MYFHVFSRFSILLSSHLKREVAIFVLKNKHAFSIHACALVSFQPGLKKNIDYMENFNSPNRVENFTYNCKVILKRLLLNRRVEISTRFTELKFQLGLKISI